MQLSSPTLAVYLRAAEFSGAALPKSINSESIFIKLSKHQLSLQACFYFPLSSNAPYIKGSREPGGLGEGGGGERAACLSPSLKAWRGRGERSRAGPLPCGLRCGFRARQSCLFTRLGSARRVVLEVLVFFFLFHGVVRSSRNFGWLIYGLYLRPATWIREVASSGFDPHPTHTVLPPLRVGPPPSFSRDSKEATLLSREALRDPGVIYHRLKISEDHSCSPKDATRPSPLPLGLHLRQGGGRDSATPLGEASLRYSPWNKGGCFLFSFLPKL